MARALRVTRQAEQTLRLSSALEREVLSRAAWRNKTLFQEALAQSGTALQTAGTAERRATMEVEDAKSPWNAGERCNYQAGRWQATWMKVKESVLELKS